MTTPDIYTVEARRRLADAYNEIAVADRYLQGGYDSTREVKTLAAALRELNWQPPVDPDLEEARKLCEAHGWGANPWDETSKLVLAAIKRGRELERGA